MGEPEIMEVLAKIQQHLTFLERKLDTHDRVIGDILDAIRQLDTLINAPKPSGQNRPFRPPFRHHGPPGAGHGHGRPPQHERDDNRGNRAEPRPARHGYGHKKKIYGGSHEH